jgi:hypothetical protein
LNLSNMKKKKKDILIKHFITTIFLNCSRFVQIELITQKDLNSSTCFQILKEQDHKLWITWNIYSKKSQEFFINDKVQSTYVQFILKEIKKPIPTKQLLAKHDVQSNKIEQNVDTKENTYNSI